jgi:uncharacterized protein YfaS (alpha-2-macroglobulin family)
MIAGRLARMAPAAAFLRLFLAFGLAAPIVCQDEAEPYFAISSQRTFGTGEKPQISLSGFRVAAVQIRVYRVKDSGRFFQQMEEPHSFGARPPRPPGKQTWIESFHNWKRGLRRDIGLTLRRQFSESPRAHLEKAEALSEKEAATSQQSAATYFAEAPLLNADQLVLSFVQPVLSTRRWNAESVPIPVKDKGVYLVEAVNHDLRAYTVLIVSDVILITKAAHKHVLTYLADRSSGEPIADAEIALLSRNSPAVHTSTDHDGLATLDLSSAASLENIRLLARHDADYALGDLPTWQFNRNGAPWSGLIYTDRPIYRPGDAVHFRGILRIAAATGYDLPVNRQVNVQISDPDGKPVYQKTLTTNTNGIIHDELTTLRTAALGNYFIEVRAGDSEMSGNFEIQEYKKPEYEVRVNPERPRVLEGESVQTTIDARYFFGEPVTGAKVKYSVFRSRYWFPFWYDADTDEGEESYGGDYFPDAASEQVAQDEGTLDADGKLTFTLPTTVSDSKLDYRYRIEVAVTDQAGREITGTGSIIATYGNVVLNVEPERYYYAAGETATFTIESRDYDSRPVSTALHLTISTFSWRNPKQDGEVKGSTDVTTAEDGSATAKLAVPRNGGEYRIAATTTTSSGRTIQATAFVWCSSAESNVYDVSRRRPIQIVPDRKIYHAGDTAHVLIVSGGEQDVPMLVTVEGRAVRSHQVLRTKGASATFDYSITEDDEPGFFVAVAFVRRGGVAQAQKRVVVPPDDHKLTLRVVTDKPQYLPGQTATYTIQATSCDGKPVKGADLSLGVVDEAIYSIRKDETADLVKFFYGLEWDSVYTENSLMYFFSGEAGKRRMRLAELRSPSVLAQLKPERLVQPKIRKYFPDTAFWAADLTTDNEGRAQAKIAFPDSLTTWRATVRGATASEMFGSVVQKTIVRKNLILRLAVPRFFVQGDDVVISSIVHNYLPSTKRAHLTVALQGLTLASGPAVQDAQIPSRGEVKIDWHVKAESVRNARITAQALTDEESDAMELQLPVNPPGVPIRQPYAGVIRNSGSAVVKLAFPGTAVTGSRSLSIRISSSVAGAIFSALDYLTSFPYGCVEQTMSSFLPDMVVTKTVRELGLKQPIDQDELSKKVQAGLDRLYGFHHDDGGWGWWVSDASHPFMTAYVVAGLAEAKNDGIAVREDMISSGAKWIENSLAHDDLEPDLRAYMEYALTLASHPDHSSLDAIYNERSKLSPYGTALLGLAFELTQDKRAGALASALESSAQQNEMEAWWPAKRDEMLDFVADVTPEASAYAMKLLSHQRPNSPLLPKAELWLVNHRDEGYWWSSTKQTAMVIYGLIDYVKRTKELQPDLTASVSLNGQTAGSYALHQDSTGTTNELLIEDKQLQQNGNEVRISSAGTGILFYSITGTHYSNEAREEKQGAITLNIVRDYFNLIPEKRSGEIVYDLQPLSSPVAQGDTLAVRLTITGSDWRYLMAEDPIPAGTEFVEHDELYHFREKPSWWEYWFTRRELHDDRVAIFDRHFAEGQKRFFYVLKVVNPGAFHISPARVAPMYQPGILATTESKTLEVR